VGEQVGFRPTQYALLDVSVMHGYPMYACHPPHPWSRVILFLTQPHFSSALPFALLAVVHSKAPRFESARDILTQSQGPLDAEFVPALCSIASSLSGKLTTLAEEFGGCTALPGQPSAVLEFKSYHTIRRYVRCCVRALWVSVMY
jgi:hypothetical protein